MIPDLIRRRDATEATLARYRDKAFDWRAGVHCVRLAQYHLKQMGHRPPTVPRIRSALGARRELRARGVASVTAMMDQLLLRIVPAQMLLGDLAAAAGEDGLDAIFVCAGPQKVLGWHEDADRFVVIDVAIGALTGAWRA